MIIVNDIYRFLDEIAPFGSAEEWDNSGLLIGSGERVVDNAVVTLDCNAAAVSLAESAGAQLIITHHPVIFDPLKSVDDKSYVWRLIQKDISVISAHTNLDIAKRGVNACLCEKLSLNAQPDRECPFLFCGETPEPLDADALARRVKDALGCDRVRITVSGRRISRIAICSGSGGDMLDLAAERGCDALITGDVKHSVFIDAERLGITVIDAGHFYTEDVVVEPLCSLLSAEFPSVRFITSHAYPVKTV